MPQMSERNYNDITDQLKGRRNCRQYDEISEVCKVVITEAGISIPI